jgi:hypothetical protein
MGKIVRAGAGAGISHKLEPEPELETDKTGLAPQHWNWKSFDFSLLTKEMPVPKVDDSRYLKQNTMHDPPHPF